MKARALRVLIVDDSPTVRQNLSEIFSGLNGVDIVGEATGSQQGLELARALQPDVVTLDVRMPGGSGLAVLRSLKQIEPVLTVVVLTNFSNPTYRKRAEQAGADFFFDKTREFPKVLEVLKNHMTREEVGEQVLARGSGNGQREAAS